MSAALRLHPEVFGAFYVSMVRVGETTGALDAMLAVASGLSLPVVLRRIVESATVMVDAQYGGLLTDTASVLVVTRSWRVAGQRLVPNGHTYDVRLSRSGATWRVTAVHPSRPGAPVRTVSPTVQRVLREDRITLPPAGRSDLESGSVHDSVALAMLAVSPVSSVSACRWGRASSGS